MSNNASWNQANHTLTIIGQQNLDAQHIKTLHSGYLAAVAKATRDGVLPTLDAFKRMLGLVFDLNVNTELSIDELWSKGSYDHYPHDMDSFIKQVFDYDHKLAVKSYKLEVELFPTDSPSAAETLKAAMAEGFRAATFREFLSFGIEHPNVQNKFRVICLAKARGEYLACLDSSAMGVLSDTSERELRYTSWDHRNDFTTSQTDCVESRALVVREN